MLILNGIRQGSASILEGTAEVGDVLDGALFYKDDPEELLEGTLALTGDALSGDVLDGKFFYKDYAKTKLEGTLALTGDADVGDVRDGKLFYKTDAKTRLEGTLVALDTSDATATADQILIGYSAYVDGIKIDGTMPQLRPVIGLVLPIPEIPIETVITA